MCIVYFSLCNLKGAAINDGKQPATSAILNENKKWYWSYQTIQITNWDYDSFKGYCNLHEKQLEPFK